jgi:hypothetical protein
MVTRPELRRVTLASRTRAQISVVQGAQITAQKDDLNFRSTYIATRQDDQSTYKTIARIPDVDGSWVELAFVTVTRRLKASCPHRIARPC